MKLRLKLLLVALLVLTSTTLEAHNPDLSTLRLIEKSPGEWLIQLDASLSALDQEIAYVYGDDAYATLEEFKELVVKHFLEKLALSINGKSIELGESFLQLGHASTLVFALNNVPDELLNLTVESKTFTYNHHSKIGFSIVKEGMIDEKFNLNQANDFTIKLILKENQFLLDETVTLSPMIKILSGLH